MGPSSRGKLTSRRTTPAAPERQVAAAGTSEVLAMPLAMLDSADHQAPGACQTISPPTTVSSTCVPAICSGGQL